MGHRSVQHCGKVLLTNHVIIFLPLGDVNELNHFAFLTVLENRGYLKAKVDCVSGL